MKLHDAFVQQLRDLLPDQCDDLLQAITATAPSVAVRVNSGKGAVRPAAARPVPWSPWGFYTDERPTFTFDTDWHAGLYYVQDASSMFIGHVISSLVQGPVRYLDLCAAPGGKTTAALQALHPQSMTVANEVVPPRARVLADNIIRWGNPRCTVTSNTPAQIGTMEHFFDVIAADVPCSGEGMMRKDDEAVAQWSPALVEQCAQRQRDILADVWPALRPGGLLIYSTCTYNRLENEDIAAFIMNELGADPIEVPVQDDWGIVPAIASDCHGYRFFPHRMDGEGLFMAAFRKHGDAAHSIPKGREKRQASAGNECMKWLAKPDDYSLTAQGDLIVTVPRDIAREVEALRASLNVINSGVELATVMGRKTVPHHALALSTACAADAFPCCEVDYATALRYLRGEAVAVDAPRGYVLIMHQGQALGFANNLGARANNLYPKGLRILSSHLPEGKPAVVDKP